MKILYKLFIALAFFGLSVSAKAQYNISEIDTLKLCDVSLITLNGNFAVGGAYSVSSVPYAPVCPLDSGTFAFTYYGDDMFSQPITLPFIFNFYGNDYNNIIIGENGILSFNTSLSLCPFDLKNAPNIPSSLFVGNALNAIYGVFQDTDMRFITSPSSIRYAVKGTAPNRMFIVSYNDVPMFSCNMMFATSQIVLYETSNIIDVYVEQRDRCENWNNGRGIIGIHNINGTDGIAAPNRNTTDVWTVSADNPEGWRFEKSTFQWQCNGEVVGTEQNLELERGDNRTDVIYFSVNDEIIDSVAVFWGDNSINEYFDTICSDYEFYFGGSLLTETGIYIDTMQTAEGCDSIIVLELIVLEYCENSIPQTSISLANIYSNNRSIVIENFVGDIAIYNVQGQIVASKYSQNGSIEIPVQQVGVYLVKIKNYFGKVVVK